MKVYTESLVSEMKKVNEKAQRPGVLCVVQGPCMEYGRVNNNNRIYSEKLIRDRILNNEKVQAAMKNKSMLGEGGHPTDRVDVSYPSVALSVEDLWLGKNGDNLLYGKFAILDTPTGRILNSLIEYGSRIGISARALANSRTSEGHEIIDERDYELITFDAVPDPGFSVARLSKVESVSRKVEDMSLCDLQEASAALRSLKSPAFESRIRDIDLEISNRVMSENSVMSIVSDIRYIKESLSSLLKKKKFEGAFSPKNMRVLVNSMNTLFIKMNKRISYLENDNKRLRVDNSELVSSLNELKSTKDSEVKTECVKSEASKAVRVNDFERDTKSLVAESRVNVKPSDPLYSMISKQFRRM